MSSLRLKAAALAERLTPSNKQPVSGPEKSQSEQTVAAEQGRELPSVFDLAVRPLAHRFFELALLSFAINILSLTVPIFVLQVYDRVVFHGGLVTLAGLFIGVLAALTFDFVLRQARSRLVQMIALRVDVGIIRALFSSLSDMPLRRMEGQSDSDWHGLLRDQETVRDTVAGPATVLLVDLPFILLFIGAIWLVAQPIAWLLITLIPVYICVAVISSAVIGRASHKEQTSAEGRHVMGSQLVAGRLTAKALGLGDALKTRWETAQATLIDRSVRRGSMVDAFSNLSVELAMLTTVIMTSFGALAIVAGELTIGGLIAANMLAARVVQPMVQLIGMWRVVSRLRDSAKRLDTAMRQPIDRKSSTVGRGRPRGLITLENVDFRYEAEEEPTIKGISATFEPGGISG
ncbi:MAG: ABC transporter transmembrane domain-containing protein, partial [Pseudomonadota bacterium]